MNEDAQHLRLLSIFHYVVGGLLALFASFPLIHLAVGIGVLLVPPGNEEEAAFVALVGWVFVIFAGIFILTGWAMAICIILAGRFLSQRRHYLFCLAMAGVECMFMPFGTVLGVFTIIVLLRDSVKSQFIALPSQADPSSNA